MTQKSNYRTVAIPIEAHRRIRRYGVEHDVSITAMMAEAIEEWLERRSLDPLSGAVGSVGGSALEAGSGVPAAGDGRAFVGSVGGEPMSSTLPEGEGRDVGEWGETL